MDGHEDQILLEAIRRNSKHGKQLTSLEKRRLAVRLYDARLTQRSIGNILGVNKGTVSRWLEKAEQTREEEREKKILDLYLQCYTDKEIAAKLGLSRRRINQIRNKLQMQLTHETPPKPPDSLQVFNVWSFSKLDKQYGVGAKGQIPGQIVENLLYYYTKPFDTVVDPMAGGGTTIDVCKAMYRRYRAYDDNPLRPDVKEWDVTQGFPPECKRVDLVFLDPPYFDMVFGELFKSSKEFYEFIKVTAKGSRKVLKKGGIVALLMCDRTKGEFECLSSECYNIFKKLRFKCIARISAPLSTESANAGEYSLKRLKESVK